MAQIKEIFAPDNVITSLVISNIEHITEGDIIAGYNFHYKIKSPYSGYYLPNSYTSPTRLVGIVAETLEDALSALYYKEPCIERDPYTDTQKIVWKGKPSLVFSPFSWLTGCVFTLSKQLFFSFEFIDDQGAIVFKADDRLHLSKSDHISLLFQNGKILDYQVLQKPEKGGFSKIACALYQDDIDLFLQSKLVSYRLTFNKEGKSPITEKCGSFYGQFLFEAVVSYVNYYLGVLNKLLPDYHLPKRAVGRTPIDYKFIWCYVYLMRDNTNGYHKIGISNKPEYREKTLQSEKPSIEMLACKKFPTRKIAEAIESALHTAYSQQRVRGEWFNLNDEDVAAIIETLK